VRRGGDRKGREEEGKGSWEGKGIPLPPLSWILDTPLILPSINKSAFFPLDPRI